MKVLKNDKIYLLHLVESFAVGGAEILLLHYIRSLGAKRYKHYVYSIGHDGAIRRKIEDLDVEVRIGPGRASIKNPIKFIVSLVILVRDLLGFIREKRIQVIQSHLSRANQLGVAIGKLTSIPTFPTVHNTAAFVDRRGVLDPRVHIIRTVDSVVYRIADRVVVVSHGIKEIVQQIYGLKDEKICVVRNGIILENSVVGVADFQGQVRIEPDSFKLIGVGALTYQKAFEVLVKAAAILVDQGFDNLLVLIAGEGEERAYLERLIEELGLHNHVRLLGNREDIISLLKASDIFIMPSRYEGLSLAMIEAMACGLPIIASDGPGLKDFINLEKNGLLFPIEDHQALAKCILRLANDRELRFRISHGARDTFKNEYDMRRNIKALDTLFRRHTANCSQLSGK